MKNLQELENGSIDKLKANLGQKRNAKSKLMAWRVEAKIWSFSSNQPVLSPIDPTHQIFLGVVKDLLPYHYNEMNTHHNAEINSFLESVDLTEEFKISVTSL